MAIIILTHYKWSDFVRYKVPYIIWTVMGGVLCIVFTPMVIARRAEHLALDTITIALGIFLIGYCIIHTVINFWIEKYRPKFYKPLFIIWAVMLILMIFSRSEYLWPECYFVLFLCFYLTEQTPTQRTNVIKGIVNGIILGFIVIQGHSLLTRPFDRVRYYGNFCNPNDNCVFLCMCLVAILGKILILTKENKSKTIKAFCFVLAGACYSFLFMTQSRTGYLTTGIVTIFFLISYCYIREKKVFIRTGVTLALIFVMMFPLTYLAVRYIPTIHPHVNFYFQEGYSEDRVHSWDARDSEKFISFREMMASILGRFTILIQDYEQIIESPVGRCGNDDVIIASNTDYIPSLALLCAKVNVAETEEKIEIDADHIPVLTPEESNNCLAIRYTIYKWYFTHLSLRGMPYDEQGFWLSEEYWIRHPHNIYLDYGINFGYPVMILFTVFIWWGIGRVAVQGIKTRSAEKLCCLLILLVPPIFGMLEYAWGVGKISTVAFYLAFKEIFCS